MTRKWYWCSAVCVALALAGCDEPDDGDADASAQTDDGGTDGGPADGGPVDAPASAAPVVTTATPMDVARGATLALSGTDLGGASAVTIGGTEQVIGENDGDSLTIDAVATDTPTGEQELVVTTAAGSSEPFTLTVLDALSVAGASAVDSVTAVVMFSRELDPATVGPEDFTIDGLTVSAATSSGTTVTLTTTTQTSGAPYDVTVADVADTFGNGLGGTASATFTGFAVAAPTITTISASELVRGFSEVTITGTNLDNAMVEIGGTAQPKVSNDESEVVVGPIASGTPLETQPLTVTTGGGTSGSMNVDVLEELQITGASSLSRTEVEVTFNRAVDDATVAPERFTISGLTIDGASASGDAVTLTTSTQTEGASYTVAVDAMLLDGYGSPASSGTFVFTGFEPPPPTEFIVVRVGDGTAPLTKKAAPVFLERRSISDGALVATVPMPTTASGANLPFTLEGTRLFEGELTRSADGQFLTIGGFQTEVGGPPDGDVSTSLVADTDGVPRVVALIDAADFSATPEIDTRTTLGTAFAETGVWGTVTDGINVWAVGGWGGVHTVPVGNAGNIKVTGWSEPSEGRSIDIFEGSLYFVTRNPTPGDGPGLYELPPDAASSTLPTTGGHTTIRTIYPLTDPFSFAMFDRDPTEPGLDTVYQVEDNTIVRFVKTAGTWITSATFTRSSGGATPIQFATCFESGGDVECIASSGAALYHMRDSGGSSPDSAALDELVSAPANTNFRGVALPPIP